MNENIFADAVKVSIDAARELQHESNVAILWRPEELPEEKQYAMMVLI